MLGTKKNSIHLPNQLRFEALEPRQMLTGDGLTGEYFNTIDLTSPANTRVDSAINFSSDALGNDAQGLVTADDNYSIRWTGWVNAEQAGDWQFTTFSNDGVRLWVDDTQIINNWTRHASTRDEGSISLTAGWHPIRLEYFQQGGTTDARLLFSGPGQTETIIPQSHLSTTNPNVGDPVANAGPDQVVILPDDSLIISGSGTDDGAIFSYQWTQLSGPNTAALAGTSSRNLITNNLIEGTYEFELTVTDNESNTDTDTVLVQVVPQTSEGSITGELRLWHRVNIDFTGPNTSETAAVNPFTDYRLDVTFTHQDSGKSYVVPGYYAADGNAANTSATTGNVWRVHFAPDEIGAWVYSASFRTGNNVAVSTAANPGSSAGFFDGAAGAFAIADTDKTGRDFRARGRLQYVGERYLRFAGNGEYFLKQGADSPENLLVYDEFDGPFTSDGQGDNFIKDWAPHVSDWNPGDPTWGDDRGKGIIGAVNYLASEGQNAFSFLPMNIGGDDRNVFPYLNYNERLRIDVSRLAQWEVLFEHADQLGLFLHFKTQETENDQLLDGGALGNQRRLYYRELIARFSHHLALNWNLGEENTNTTQQRREFAQFFHDNDPYQHHIVIHTFPNQQDQVYDPLLGNASELTGASIQTGNSDFRNVHANTAKWVNDSAAAGKPWAVAVDEPGDAQHAIRPDNDAGNSHVDGRKNALWGTLLAGGWGNEYYFGYGHAHSDLTLQDFRSRDDWWDYTRYALEFFKDNDIPFWELENDNSISTASDDYGFFKTGESYVVYLKNGGTTGLNLSDVSGTYDVRWFDPRNGGDLQVGSVAAVSGGGIRNLGTAPNSTTEDWAILVERRDSNAPNQPPEVIINDYNTAVQTEGNVFEEQNGLVIIEAENTETSNLGLWNVETDYAGFSGDSYLQFTGNNTASGPPNSPLEYRFRINQSGLYYLHLRAARDTTHGQPGDHSNDAYVRVEGDFGAGPNAGNSHGDDAPLWMLRSDTKFFGGTPDSFSWNSGNRLDPGGHDNKRVAVYDFKAGEEYTLVVSGRSQWFSIDRIMFRHANVGVGAAQNLSNPESPTIAEGSGDGLTFNLEGIAIDDGQQLLTPQLQWSLLSGPGTATFSDPLSANTQVEFSTPGTYVVELLADDGEYQVSTTRTIVAPALTPAFSDQVLSPIDDVMLQGTTAINDGLVRTQQSGPARVGYFKFNVDNIGSETVNSARLRLTVTQDAGSGPLNLYLGNSNAWTEETITSANAPTLGALVDTVTGTHGIGQVVEFDLSSVITADGVYSFILQHGGGGSDVWFSSKEGSAPPQLVLGFGGSADYQGDGDIDGSDFLAWQRGFGLPNAKYHEGDGNGDGNSDNQDLAIWRDAYAASASFGALAQTATELAVTQAEEPPTLVTAADLAMASLAFNSVSEEKSEPSYAEQSVMPTDPTPSSALSFAASQSIAEQPKSESNRAGQEDATEPSAKLSNELSAGLDE